MKTELIDGNQAFAVLEEEWNALVAQGMTNTPFQQFAYQKSWWQHLQPAHSSLHTIVVRHEDGRLAGIASFYLIEGVLYFNGCVEETDYLDLIVAENEAEPVWTAVFDCLCRNDFPAWQALDLCNIPATSLSRQILQLAAEKRGFSFAESVNEVCPIIELPGSFEDYLENIDSKQRREIKRKLRRAEGADAKMRIVNAEDNLEVEIENFLTLLQASTFEKRDWLSDGRRALFHDTAKAAMASGMLQLIFIEVDGRNAATLFNFDYANKIWVYNSGLDPANYGSLSLGVVITAKAIEYAAENGRAEFDFLRGNETYKYRFGAIDTTIYRIQIKRGV
jgi:CelD/BcsL family acetyltransferase involved in cellulose biosynthesis